MTVQAHLSGQISGQDSNQGTMSQQNGNSPMQNLVGGAAAGLEPSRVSPLDNDIMKLRMEMRLRIFNIFQQKQPSPTDDALKGKYMDVARRLEDGLFRISNTKEEYMNQSTLETRLASLIKGRHINAYNQRDATMAGSNASNGYQHSSSNNSSNNGQSYLGDEASNNSGGFSVGDT